MDDNNREEIKETSLPFNNLFLNTGYVSGLNDWWMYLAGIFAAFLGYAICQLFISFPLTEMAINKGITLSELTENPAILFDPEKTGIDKNILLCMLLAMFAFALGGLFLIVKKVHHKTILSVITAYHSIRYKRFIFAFCLWGSLVVITTLVACAIDPSDVTLQFKPLEFIILLVICIFLMPIQTSAEEIIIRGYLMQGLALLFKNGWIPLVITSLLFGLLHFDNPEVETYGWWLMLPFYSIFGVFLGLLTLLDEGLELALGIHLANNLLSSLLVTSSSGVIKTDAIFLVKATDPMGEIILTVGMFGITFFILWKRYRWKNFKLIIK